MIRFAILDFEFLGLYIDKNIRKTMKIYWHCHAPLLNTSMLKKNQTDQFQEVPWVTYFFPVETLKV